jgi:hypothetical protein
MEVYSDVVPTLESIDRLCGILSSDEVISIEDKLVVAFGDTKHGEYLFSLFVNDELGLSYRVFDEDACTELLRQVQAEADTENWINSLITTN